MQYLKDEVRQGILDSALEIFSSVGYEKATMQSIADRFGISKGNLYRYYPSKQDIFLALIDKPIKEVQRLTSVLTDKSMLTGTSDEIALSYIEYTFPIFTQYRNELLMIIRSDISRDGILYRDMLMNGLLANFFQFDRNKLPIDFIQTLSQMLITGIGEILANYKSNEDMLSQLSALLKYHVWGTLAFTNLR